MGKNRSASGLTNVIQYDNNGNITFVSGSTTLMQVSSSGAITTTGVISGSNALSASFSLNSALLNGTGSVGFATTASLLTVSSSQQQISASLLQVSASYISLSGSYNTFSGSASTRITDNSSSIQQVSSSQQQISSSQQQISSSLLNVISIFATTGSNSFRATQSITGSLTVTGQIIAQTLNVQQVTSSIIYSSGSNNFGCDLNSRQTFTGSVLITGSLTIAGASSATSYSGTTIYGSTAVCSAVGKFTTCIDITSVATTGTALRINADNLTTGTALSIISNDGSASHTGNLVEICNAFNAGAAAKLMCLYQGDDGDGIYINMARGGVGLTVDGAGGGYSAIFNNGNVGIGISSPDYKLQISTTTKGIGTNEAGVVISSNESLAANIGGTLGFGATSDYGIVTLAKVGGYRENATGASVSSYLAFETRAGGNAVSEKMRITSDGRVGINVSPAASTIFHVQDNTARSAVYRLEPYTNAYESKLVISSRSSGDGGIRYGVGGGNDMNIFSYGTMRFNVGSGNISGNVTCERLNIDSNGIATFACTICAPNVDITGQIKRIDTIYLGGGLNGTSNVTSACYQIESAYALASSRTSVSKGGQYASSAYYVLLAAAQDVYVYYKLALIQSSFFCGYTRFVNSQDGSTRSGISQYSFDNGGTWTTLGTTSFGPGYGYAAGGVATPSGNYSGVVVFRAALTSGSGGTLIGIDQLYFMSCGYGMYFINNLG